VRLLLLFAMENVGALGGVVVEVFEKCLPVKVHRRDGLFPDSEVQAIHGAY
jgi:hypothetical protein